MMIGEVPLIPSIVALCAWVLFSLCVFPGLPVVRAILDESSLPCSTAVPDGRILVMRFVPFALNPPPVKGLPTVPMLVVSSIGGVDIWLA